MADLMEAVADLTQLRDQDALETALATLLLERVGAAGLILWRLTRRDGRIWLHERIRVQPAANGVAANRAVETAALLLDQADTDLRACHEQKAHLHLLRAQGGFRDLFPLVNGRKVEYLLEIYRTAELGLAGANLVFGLLRIYCNHLGILEHADRDELTGLCNRRTFGDSFKRILAPPDRRHVEPALTRIHLAIIDIDCFKRINDTFGHPYGDEVLVLLARLMSHSFRETDLMFRFGGEEFLVMLPNTDFAEAERALERFRTEVENFNFSQVGRVTVSIGFTAVCTGDSGPAAFGRADQALYVAKHGGRNQVQCYELLIANGSLVSAISKEQEVELF